MKAIMFVFFAAAWLAAAQQSETPSNGAVANGKLLFTKIGCYECHGYAGQGGRAGARIVPPPLKLPELIGYVRRPPGEMPAYTEKVVSDRDLQDIYAYLNSFPPPKAVNDIPLLKKIKDRQ